MIAYLLASVIISVIGFTFYALVLRKKASLRQHKAYLYVIIFCSLTFPYGGKMLLDRPEIIESSYFLSAITNNQHCTEADIQEECQVLKEEYGECTCDRIYEQNRVAYKANIFYAKIDEIDPYVKVSFAAAVVLIAGMLLLRILYLVYISFHQKKRLVEINGCRCLVIETDKPLSIGSFKLLNNYIIWNKDYDYLGEQEKRAILLHEISHINQKNTWELIALHFVQMFWFVNPVFYFIRKELITISEYLADEFVIRQNYDRKWYAQLLLQLQAAPNLALVSNFSASQLRKRVQRLLKPVKTNSRKLFFTKISMLVFVLITAAILSFSVITEGIAQIKEQQIESIESSNTCEFCLSFEQVRD